MTATGDDRASPTSPAVPVPARAARRPWLRLALLTALVALAAAAAAFLVAAGWRPLGAKAPPFERMIPEDVDVALRFDARELSAHWPLRDAASTGALAVALGLDEIGTLEPAAAPLLGDDAALAVRDGSRLLLVRVTGPLQAARLGLLRAACRRRGDGDILELTAGDGDAFHAALVDDVWIASDDEDLVREALECLRGNAAALGSRSDFLNALGPGKSAARVSAWMSDDTLTYVLGVLEVPDAIRDAAEGSARAIIACEESWAEVWLEWSVPAARVTRRPFVRDFASEAEGVRAVARRDIDAQAARRVAVDERGIGMRITRELAESGLSGESLRSELDRRLVAARPGRLAAARTEILDEAERRASALATVDRLEGSFWVAEGGHAWLQFRAGPR